MLFKVLTICKRQFNFFQQSMKSRSISTNLSVFTQFVSDSINARKLVFVKYLDFANLNRNILFTRRHFFEFPNALIHFFHQSYFFNKRRYVQSLTNKSDRLVTLQTKQLYKCLCMHTILKIYRKIPSITDCIGTKTL